MATDTPNPGEDHDSARPGSGLVGWARRADRVRSAWGWWNWLFSGGSGNAIVGLAGMATVATTGALVGVDGVRTGWGIPGPVSVQATVAASSQRLGEDAVLYRVDGADKAGRKAIFDLIVLSRDTVWVKGKTEEIARSGRVMPAADFQRVLASGELGRRVAVARELIAVGVASREGEQVTEETRAGLRAQRIAGWLANIDGSKKPIWSLNLGQHRGDCTGCDGAVTDWQRPIIVVGLIEADPGVNLAEALADAMTARANLPSPGNYTRFTLSRSR